MAYYQSNLIKVDGTSVKYNSNGELQSPSSGDAIGIDDTNNGTSTTTTYSANKIQSLVSNSTYELPVASTTTFGGIKIDNQTIKIDEDGVAKANVSMSGLAVEVDPETLKDKQFLQYSSALGALVNVDEYELPTASSNVLGGVKVGSSLDISNGVLNYNLPTATTSNLGGVKIDGTSITINEGVISAAPSSSYVLPKATTSDLGGVIVDGTTITVNQNGVITATAQEGTTYEKASTLADGLMSKEHYSKLEGIATNANNYSLPQATTSDLGGVIVDGSTITINNNGVISTVNSGEETVSYFGSYIVNNDNLLLPSSNRNYNVTIDITDSSSTSSEPAWSYNTTTGEITINGELKKDQYTEQELCHFNGDDNFYNNYVKNKKFILFGIPQIDNEYLDIEIYIRHYDDSDTKYCEINKNTSSTIVEFEEYDNWYQLFIRLTNTNTNSYISFDNFKFTPKLIELEDVIQVGSGLSIDNNILSTTFEGVESIAPLSQITYNPTIGDSETRLVLSNFQYKFFELESEDALSKGISKWYTIDGSVLNIKTPSNIHINCSATGSDGSFVTGKLYIYNSVNDTWSLTETLQLNYTGQSRVSSHPENYFTTPIVSNNLYKLYFSVVRRPTSGSDLFTNIYVKIYMDIEEGSYISKNGYFGNTTGTHLGNANLTGLTLEGTYNKILEFNQGKCNFEINNEESDYNGTYFGITGANFRKYITVVDANDVETTGSYEISINVNDGDIRRKVQTDITDSSTIVTKTVQWAASDERIKNSITSLDAQLSVNFIDKTLPKSFKYNDSDLIHYGMTAQEARKVLDELGETNSGLEYSIGDTNIPDQRNINYSEYIPHLINYVKDLRAEINRLKGEN